MTKKEQNLKILNNNFFYKNNFNSNKDCINDPISYRSTSENEKKNKYNGPKYNNSIGINSFENTQGKSNNYLYFGYNQKQSQDNCYNFSEGSDSIGSNSDVNNSINFNTNYNVNVNDNNNSNDKEIEVQRLTEKDFFKYNYIFGKFIKEDGSSYNHNSNSENNIYFNKPNSPSQKKDQNVEKMKPNNLLNNISLNKNSTNDKPLFIALKKKRNNCGEHDQNSFDNMQKTLKTYNFKIIIDCINEELKNIPESYKKNYIEFLKNKNIKKKLILFF